jgi:hypothetical protein
MHVANYGVSLKAVQATVGHAKLTTKRPYLHNGLPVNNIDSS